MAAGVIKETPPGGSRGSTAVVFVLDVVVAFCDPEFPDFDPDAERDADAVEMLVDSPKEAKEAVTLEDADGSEAVIVALSLLLS